MSHHDIWQAVDRLASHHGLSPSGLAKKAGLDATSFNKSKRVMNDGRLRWPSTESIMRILSVTNTSWDEFVLLMSANPSPQMMPSRDENGKRGIRMRGLPLIHLDQASQHGNFDEMGNPKGGRWDEILFPDFGNQTVFTIEVIGDQHRPIFRDGDRIIIAPTTTLRRGDRVFVKTKHGQVYFKEFYRQTARAIELRALEDEMAETQVPLEEIEVTGRLLWVSQA